MQSLGTVCSSYRDPLRTSKAKVAARMPLSLRECARSGLRAAAAGLHEIVHGHPNRHQCPGREEGRMDIGSHQGA